MYLLDRVLESPSNGRNVRSHLLAVAISLSLVFASSAASAHGEAAEPEHVARASSTVDGLPDELPYVPGEVAPKGYRADRRPREGLLVGGVLLFAASWAPGLVIAGGCLASECRGARHGWETTLALPFAGPIVYALGRCAGTHERDCYFGSAFWMADAAVQIGGFAMFLAGRSKRDVWVRSDVAYDVRPMSFGRDGGGLSIVGTF